MRPSCTRGPRSRGKDADERRRARMTHRPESRRHFLMRAGWSSLAAAAALGASGRTPARAQGASSYPDFLAPSPKPPRRGGVLTRTTAWDPPVLDPRLTNSVGLFQIYALTGNRLVRHLYADETANATDLTLKREPAES